MLQKSVGVVIHTLKYSDSSNIVDIYTLLHGRVSFLVPATRSKKSAVKSLLFQPLTLIELEADFRHTASLIRIKEAKAFPFKSIPYDPYKAAIALFLAEFLYRAIKEETENEPLFAYIKHSIEWLDECRGNFSNFHLVFLMRLSRFLGLYPNLDNYAKGDFFDLANASFVSQAPLGHTHYVNAHDSFTLTQLMRMNYDTMHLFAMKRVDRNRCLSVILNYYHLHIPGFKPLNSLNVLQELF